MLNYYIPWKRLCQALGEKFLYFFTAPFFKKKTADFQAL